MNPRPIAAVLVLLGLVITLAAYQAQLPSPAPAKFTSDSYTEVENTYSTQSAQSIYKVNFFTDSCNFGDIQNGTTCYSQSILTESDSNTNKTGDFQGLITSLGYDAPSNMTMIGFQNAISESCFTPAYTDKPVSSLNMTGDHYFSALTIENVVAVSYVAINHYVGYSLSNGTQVGRVYTSCSAVVTSITVLK